MSLFRRKPLDVLIAEGGDEAHGLKKALTWVDLTALGIGAIIGAGIFATLGSATSGGEGQPPAGPGVVVSILLTAVACGFCALCYAEFASLVPVAGSAYTYAYATLGELVAWIIGWDLILEYAVGNIAVAISWAAYFRQLVAGFGVRIPAWMATDYRSTLLAAKAAAESGAASLSPEAAIAYQAHLSHPVVAGIPVVFNLLAVGITALITWILVVGVKESARFNNVVVVLKLATLLFFIVVGAFWVKPAHWTPFFPGGFHGVWTGASLIFFAYIGFDAISTAAEECKDPGRDMPRGILASLGICTLLYVVAALVLTGMIPYGKLVGVADPLAAGFAYVHQDWAAGLLAFGAVIALTSVLLVFQLGQPRILMAMSRDGLLSPWFSKIHPRFRTPHVTTILTGVFVAFFSAIANIDEIVQLTNIGTLFAFILVAIGILVLRVREPERPRKFRVPFSPVTPVLGILMCLFLMQGLPGVTWIRFGLWLLVGLALYVVYGIRQSRLAETRGR
ncbi:MAG TPA: amino acid permease [Thermoanaerobaculia bacterium]|nr:amino acid permease [Thermoanaerobaculia bacterium]